MNTKLITGLRVAANALETGIFYYKWSHPACCNCGVLCCALTGKSAAGLARELPSPLSTWENMIGEHCPITGIPTQTVFRELFAHGLTQRDLIQLEDLSDPKIVARLHLTERRRVPRSFLPLKFGIFGKLATVPVKPACDKKAHVIAYLRAWADLLVEEGRLHGVRQCAIIENQRHFYHPGAAGAAHGAIGQTAEIGLAKVK